ncbi:MAG: hypothetical protein OEW08_12440, partial [Gammaproteobacteria bacterium]|nr:hypothetical protein [Gammaproteobacteria bacterium]
METKTRRARRNATEWQRVIDEQKRSGLSQETFCRQHDIGYGSFLNWKTKLAGGSQARTADPSFIELPTLQIESTMNWDIELDLGLG